MVKLRYNSIDVFLYLILIPFLYPRGFAEYFSIFKTVFDLWLLVAMAFIFLLFLYQTIRKQTVLRPCLFFILLYYLIFIGITFAVQGSVTEGVQKLFVAPILCLFSIMCLEDHKKSFLRCVSNIMIVNFILNLTLFNQLLFPAFFSENLHILFLGHVQVVAPLGILGVYISYLLYRMDRQEKYKAILFGFLSIANMLYARTSAALIVLSIFALGWLLIRVFKLRLVFCLDPRIYVLIYILLNMGLIYFATIYRDMAHMFTVDMTLNGRVFIWESALELIEEQPIIGYGAYGVLMNMFWHAIGVGMNYAHNEILQRLMDGGVVLLIAFFLLLLSYIKPIRRLKHDKSFMSMANLCLIAMLFVMIFESLTEYYYIFIFLSLLVFAPEFSAGFRTEEKIPQKRKQKHGNRIKTPTKN